MTSNNAVDVLNELIHTSEAINLNFPRSGSA